ncbi:MAG: diguanylate cyclase [Deltaproteobacteria bacterium]|nr:diguanylate cyclase [Deltaproteobacteria bacterium]
MDNQQTITILLVEDDPGLARLSQKKLERQGYVVHIASNGQEGLAMFDESEYDILLVDYDMPVCGGLEVIRSLKTKRSLPPTIMVTGKGNEKIAVEAIKLGASDYIVKDVDLGYLELLPIVIDNVLQKDQLISEKQKMLEVVKESEERYRRLVELAPDGISIHVEGNFVFINPAGARLLGASGTEQLLGNSILDFVHPDYRQIVIMRLKDLEEQANVLSWTEEKFVRFDGTEMNVEMAGIPFKYKGKQAVQLIFRDITERKMAEQRLEYLALYDPLTDLPNRRSFFDRFSHCLAQAERYKRLVALLYIDLDHFKEVNDTLGHDIGDLLLKGVTNRLQDCLRKSDVPARMGGDEFTVILTEVANTQDAEIVAQRIVESITSPYHIGGHECSVGVSIGIALYPSDGDDIEELLRKADFAMYNAKKIGNDVRFFSHDETGMAAEENRM